MTCTKQSGSTETKPTTVDRPFYNVFQKYGHELESGIDGWWNRVWTEITEIFCAFKYNIVSWQFS